MNAVEKISGKIGIDLESILPQLENPSQFTLVCQNFVEQADQIQPLTFLSFLRKNGFPLLAKLICRSILQTRPEILSRVLADVPDEITIRHICPCCHYLMSDTEFRHIRFGFDECPRCNQRKLSEFKTQIRRKGKIKW